jgi:hypothetical protein
MRGNISSLRKAANIIHMLLPRDPASMLCQPNYRRLEAVFSRKKRMKTSAHHQARPWQSVATPCRLCDAISLDSACGEEEVAHTVCRGRFREGLCRLSPVGDLLRYLPNGRWCWSGLRARAGQGPAGDLAIFSAPRSRGGISDVPRHLTMKGREYRSDVHIQQAVESSPFGTSARVDSCSLLEPQDEEVVEDCMNTISANTQSHYPLPHL